MVLELWVDEIPSLEGINKQTCTDFLDLIGSCNVVICTNLDRKFWISEKYAEWRELFDSKLGVGKFDRHRRYWEMPLQKEKNNNSREALDLLTKSPDNILRLAMHNQEVTSVKNAKQFKDDFSLITATSKIVKIYDRYLLSVQRELMQIDSENAIGYVSEFSDSGIFIDMIRSVNLIIESLADSVEELQIYSEMLDYRNFKRSIEKWKSKSKLDVKINPKEQWKKWVNNSGVHLKKLSKFVLENLSANREILISFNDCSTESVYPEMEHDRYVKYSQNRVLISSGGFKNVTKDIIGNDLEEINLLPKTFLIKVLTDENISLTGSNVRVVGKKKIKS